MKSIQTYLSAIATLLAICILSNTAAQSAVESASSDSPAVAGSQQNAWSYSITPYAWMKGMEGTVGIGDLEVPVDESFSDILDDLELGMMLAMEAHKGKWGVFGDVEYAKLESDQETLLGIRTTEVKEWILTSGALYRVVDNGQMQIDMGAGIRYTHTKLSISAPIGSASDSDDALDPMLMARLRYQAGEKVFFVFTGGIGGFGVDADLIWQLGATVGYNITESMALLFGYRHFDYKFEDDITVDIATRGFAVGMSFLF